MIYANNNGIIPMNEGLFSKLFTKKNSSNNIKKSDSIYTNKQRIEILRKAVEMFNIHYNEIKQIIKSEVDKSEYSARFHIQDSITIDNMFIFVKKSIVIIEHFVDIYDENDIHHRFDRDIVNECYKTLSTIEKKLNEYAKNNAPYLKFEFQGDGVGCDILIKDLDLNIPLNEGILKLTKEEKEGLDRIKNGVKSLFKKKNNTKNNNYKYKPIPLDDKLFKEYMNKILNELKKICKTYKNSAIYPEIFEYSNIDIIYWIFHEDQEFNTDNIDLLYEIGGSLEDSDIFKEIKNNVGAINIGYGDGDEGCLYIDMYQKLDKINNKNESTIFRYADII